MCLNIATRLTEIDIHLEEVAIPLFDVQNAIVLGLSDPPIHVVLLGFDHVGEPLLGAQTLLGDAGAAGLAGAEPSHVALTVVEVVVASTVGLAAGMGGALEGATRTEQIAMEGRIGRLRGTAKTATGAGRVGGRRALDEGREDDQEDARKDTTSVGE